MSEATRAMDGTRCGVIVLVAALLAAGCGATDSSRGPGLASPSAQESPASPSGSLGESSAAPSTSALVLWGPLPIAALDGTKTSALQGVLDDFVAAGAPDVIAAIITEQGVWAGAAGVGGPDGRAATADDEFAIASITKTFTAALILRLVEQGKMELDAPLASYLGELQVDANGATVREALAMRAGLGDHGPDVAAAIVADPGHAWTADEIVSGYPPPIYGAGEGFSYSSPTYELLAIAAQNVTGMTFASALRAELLDPVGADRILEQDAESVTPQPWALPLPAYQGAYQPDDLGKGGALSSMASATAVAGAASMASDAPSLAAWMWHLFAGDLIDASSLALMTGGQPYGFGMGLEELPFATRAYGLAGNKTGYGCIFAAFPDQRALVVVFVNDPDRVVEPVINGLLMAATAP